MAALRAVLVTRVKGRLEVRTAVARAFMAAEGPAAVRARVQRQEVCAQERSAADDLLKRVEAAL